MITVFLIFSDVFYVFKLEIKKSFKLYRTLNFSGNESHDVKPKLNLSCRKSYNCRLYIYVTSTLYYSTY